MKLMWGERFQGRYDARVHDLGKVWWLSVKDARTGEVFYECDAGKTHPSTRVRDLAFCWRAYVQKAVYRYENWAAIPTVDRCGIPALGIEAATAVGTTQIGPTEGESPTAKPERPNTGPHNV